MTNLGVQPTPEVCRGWLTRDSTHTHTLESHNQSAFLGVSFARPPRSIAPTLGSHCQFARRLARFPNLPKMSRGPPHGERDEPRSPTAEIRRGWFTNVSRPQEFPVPNWSRLPLISCSRRHSSPTASSVTQAKTPNSTNLQVGTLHLTVPDWPVRVLPKARTLFKKT